MFLKLNKLFDCNTLFWIVKHILIALVISVSIFHLVEFHFQRTEWHQSDKWSQDDNFFTSLNKWPKMRILISIVIPAIIDQILIYIIFNETKSEFLVLNLYDFLALFSRKDTFPRSSFAEMWGFVAMGCELLLLVMALFSLFKQKIKKNVEVVPCSAA